jgi:hypothetical protein
LHPIAVLRADRLVAPGASAYQSSFLDLYAYTDNSFVALCEVGFGWIGPTPQTQQVPSFGVSLAEIELKKKKITILNLIIQNTLIIQNKV